ncbi:nitronate monooxygenase, partial [Paraburkholderia aspalathi]|nr:nitronate monooxygenase [Paraburkholderia aspalathi]
TDEARATDAYKQMIVASSASDIVYSNYFTGIHGNYLKASVVAAGLDPDNLPIADPTKMDFDHVHQEGTKAWKDIWGCGQGIGAVNEIVPTAKLIDRLECEFNEARLQLCSGA